MAAGQGQLIQLSDYTTIKNKVDAVFGTGSGDSGYGQTSTTIIKSANSTISHTEWVALRNDMAKVRQHQIGGTIGTSTALDGENLVDLSVINPPPILITEDIRNQYDNFSNIITANRFLIDNNNKSTSSATTATYTNEWNGTLIHTLAMTGVSTGDGSANNIRYFFNSGSVINFNASRAGVVNLLSGSSNPKNDAWTTILNNLNTISFGYTSTITTGNGTGFPIGWYDLTTSDQMIYQLLGSNIAELVGTEYETNAYQIYARRDENSTTVTFSIKFCDNDIYGTDNNVGGILTSSINQVYATGTNISVSVLIPSSTIGNNTFSGGAPFPEFYIVPNKTSVIKGETITFNITTQYFESGTLYWSTGGTAGSDRFTTANTGQVVISGSIGTIQLTIATDTVSRGVQSFYIQMYTDSGRTNIAGYASITVTIRAQGDITYTIGSGSFVVPDGVTSINVVYPTVTENVTTAVTVSPNQSISYNIGGYGQTSTFGSITAPIYNKVVSSWGCTVDASAALIQNIITDEHSFTAYGGGDDPNSLNSYTGTPVPIQTLFGVFETYLSYQSGRGTISFTESATVANNYTTRVDINDWDRNNSGYGIGISVRQKPPFRITWGG